MALPPTNDPDRNNKLANRKAAEQDMLLREVDEAVRQDQTAQFAQRYGKLIIAGLIVARADEASDRELVRARRSSLARY